MFDETHFERTGDRFHTVDALAEHLFEAMPDFTGTTPDTSEPAGLVAETVSDQSNAHADSLLARTERAVTALVQALDGDRSAPTRRPNGSVLPDISFYAARRRSQLPDGIELLEGAPSCHSDDDMLSSIRSLIDAHDAEQHAARIAHKRARNRQVLPPLEPQPTASETTQTPIVTPHRPSFMARVRSGLRHAFGQDTFLACALSVWAALALAVFIEPSVSGMLLGTSTFLLFVAACLFPDHITSQPAQESSDQNR